MILKYIFNSAPSLKEQLKSIGEISDIIGKQISDIDNKGKNETARDGVGEFKRSKLLYTKKSYLVFFNDIVQFLLEKLKNDDEKNLRFYLPNIRTLSDIYSQLLFVCNQDENRQVAICVADSLFTLAQSENKPREMVAGLPKVNDGGVIESYNKHYEHSKPFLAMENIDIPENIKDFSKEKLKKLNLNFPPMTERAKNGYIEKTSPRTLKIFPGAIREIIDTQWGFSNYVHGNILFAGHHGTEKFWIISKIQVLGSLIVELINTDMPSISGSRELDGWLKKIVLEKPKFIKLWREARQSVNDSHAINL